MSAKDDFLTKLSQRFSHHQDTVVNCPTCQTPDPHGCMHSAAINGQRPETLFLKDGADIDPDIFGLGAPKVFSSTGFPNLIPPHGYVLSQGFPNSAFATAEYGAKHLKIPTFVIFVTSKSPTAHMLVDSTWQRQNSQLQRFLVPWRRLAVPLMNKVRQAGRDLGLNSSEAQRHLTALALAQENTRVIAAMVKDLDLGDRAPPKVLGIFLDCEREIVRPVDPARALTDLYRDNDGQKIAIPNVPPQALFFASSCADSRARVRDAMQLTPGEAYSSHRIALMMTAKDEVLRRGIPDSTWPMIALAAGQQQPMPFVLMPHSKCGGATALVQMCQGMPVNDPFLKLWLNQAKPVGDKVLDYAERRGLTDIEQLALLAANETAKANANFIRELDPDLRIYLPSLNIVTRGIDMHDPAAPIGTPGTPLVSRAKEANLPASSGMCSSRSEHHILPPDPRQQVWRNIISNAPNAAA